MPVLSSSLTPPRAKSAQPSLFARPVWLDRWARRAVLARLRNLQHGRLHLQEGDSQFVFGDLQSTEIATVEVLDPRMYREIALGGSLGAGDAFVRGYWRSGDLLSVMRLFAKNLSQKNELQVAIHRCVSWGGSGCDGAIATARAAVGETSIGITT